MQRIIFSPSKYIQGYDEIRHLISHYQTLGQSGAYLLVDKFVYDTYPEAIVSGFLENSIPYHLEVFQGDCTKIEIEKQVAKFHQHRCDCLIAIGGGKILDVGKACAYYGKMPIIVVPTVASTDAPCSAISVLYHSDGKVDRYLHLPFNPNIVLMDTHLLVQAPPRLLVAGMGDALATYYEAQACLASQSRTHAGGKTSLTAMALARLCLDTLLENGEDALTACKNQTVTTAFENIIETNTYLSGIGFESGGLAAAHAIHNGLTLLPESRHSLHGEKVAFTTLVQLVLEKRTDREINEVITFCKKVGLPTCLKDLAMEQVSRESLYAVAQASILPDEPMHNMPFPVTADDVFAAILTADKLGSEKS